MIGCNITTVRSLLNAFGIIPAGTAIAFNPFDLWLGKDLEVEIIRNNHIVRPGNPLKSVSFKVHRVKRKLREEFIGMPGAEIGRLRAEKGEDVVTHQVRETILGYSGDTPVESLTRWNDTKVLIHEATFLTKEAGLNNKLNKHSTLPEVMEMVAASNVENLVLSHFSSRYLPREIDRAILANCKEYNIQIPVYRILPGVTYTDLLAHAPINT